MGSIGFRPGSPITDSAARAMYEWRMSNMVSQMKLMT